MLLREVSYNELKTNRKLLQCDYDHTGAVYDSLFFAEMDKILGTLGHGYTQNLIRQDQLLQPPQVLYQQLLIQVIMVLRQLLLLPITTHRHHRSHRRHP